MRRTFIGAATVLALVAIVLTVSPDVSAHAGRVRTIASSGFYTLPARNTMVVRLADVDLGASTPYVAVVEILDARGRTLARKRDLLSSGGIVKLRYESRFHDRAVRVRVRLGHTTLQDLAPMLTIETFNRSGSTHIVNGAGPIPAPGGSDDRDVDALRLPCWWHVTSFTL